MIRVEVRERVEVDGAENDIFPLIYVWIQVMDLKLALISLVRLNCKHFQRNSLDLIISKGYLEGVIV